ncbi:DoxX-like family protein [Neobacillus sp. D3-1R]|uniref:DoxX-like family protein n=1 Tax=Neobacillus sp. D3-1R TaxID=3445778 RepID=UPI003F9F4161
MDRLWEYTQNPAIHTEWDVRFTEITYLEKCENKPQQFLYKTKIGFGIEIAGKGESGGQKMDENGERVSSLKFSTDHPLSLIQTGRGYWKYKQNGKTIDFLTQYDYDTRFGKVGEWIDHLLFRPLLGWATAWSFDALKLWLEKGYHPRQSMIKTATYWLICWALAFIWIYQGLVPKLLFLHPQEVKMTSALFGVENSPLVVKGVGALEMIFGVLWILPFLKRKLFLIQSVLMVCLTVAAVLSDMTSYYHPFNPITLNVSILILSVIGYINSNHLPSANHCQRKRKG